MKKKLTQKEIDEGFASTVQLVYPMFIKWVHEVKKFHTLANDVTTILLWYEFIGRREK